MRSFSRTLLAALVGTGTLGGCAQVLGDFRLPGEGVGGSGGGTSSSTGSTSTGGCDADETSCEGVCVTTSTDPARAIELVCN